MNECDGAPITFIYKSRQWAGFGYTVIVSWSLFQHMIFSHTGLHLFGGSRHVSLWVSLFRKLPSVFKILFIFENLSKVWTVPQCGPHQVVRDAHDFSFSVKWISERDKREKALMIILSIGYFIILQLIDVFLIFSNSASIVLMFSDPVFPRKRPWVIYFFKRPFSLWASSLFWKTDVIL